MSEGKKSVRKDKRRQKNQENRLTKENAKSRTVKSASRQILEGKRAELKFSGLTMRSESPASHEAARNEGDYPQSPSWSGRIIGSRYRVLPRLVLEPHPEGLHYPSRDELHSRKTRNSGGRETGTGGLVTRCSTDKGTERKRQPPPRGYCTETTRMSCQASPGHRAKSTEATSTRNDGKLTERERGYDVLVSG